MDAPEEMEKLDQEGISPKELNALVAKRTRERRVKLIEKCVAALTLHGYSQFHEASGIRKILWGTILITMAIFFIGLTYLSYFSQSYYSQVVELDSEKVEQVDFPTITICNYNPVYAANMYERFPLNITKKEFLTFYYQVLSNRGNILKLNNITLVNRIIRKLEAKKITAYSDILKLFEINAENDIYSYVINKLMGKFRCMYDFEPCDLTKDFRNVFRSAGQSLCKQFNYYDKKNTKGRFSTKIGLSSGLFMYWSLEGEQYHYDYSLHGLLVEIHHHGTPQHLIDYNNLITLEPGVFTTIELEQVKTKRQPPPYKPNCTNKMDFQVIKDYPYSRAMCQVDCLLQKTLDSCKCIGDQFKDYTGSAKICNITEMACTFKVSRTGDHESCHQCPVECDSIGYKVSTTRMAIGNKMMYNLVESLPDWKRRTRLETESYIKENIVGFRIGFKSLEVQFLTYKEAVQWYERISMVGGSIGLLLGFSFITGFEILFFLFDYITTPMYITHSRRHLGDKKALGSVRTQ